MRKVSWEIVLAGLTFMAIGLYLINPAPEQQRSTGPDTLASTSAPPPPGLPGSIVIDLDNLEDLKELEKLKELKNLEKLESLGIKLQNLDEVIQKHTQNYSKEQLDKDLKKLEQELQKVEEADFNVKLQDQKVYINRDYNVKEAQWSEVDPGVYVFRESFSVSELQALDLQLSFGNINIIGSDRENGELTLRATGNIDNAEDLSQNVRLERKTATSKALLKVGAEGSSSFSDRVNLEATLKVPKALALDIQTQGGHITADNLSQSQTLSTSGGHITAHALKGKTVAQTQGGHITVDQLQGEASLTTGGGHIKVRESNGSLTARTSGGHIDISESAGSVSAKTSGGNISASLTGAEGRLEFTTSAGNISLAIPESISADVDISGTAVDLDKAFDFNGTTHPGSIEGTINGGGFPLVVHCGYGNVTVKAN